MQTRERLLAGTLAGAVAAAVLVVVDGGLRGALDWSELALLFLVSLLAVRLVALGRQQDQQLARAIAYRDAFLRSVAHELRTPLTVVATGVTTLRDNAHRLPPEHVQTTLEIVDRNVRRLTDRVEDLTELDRLMRRVVVVPRTPTNLSDLVLDVLDTMDGNAHRVAVRVEPDLWVDADAVRLRRAVEEILANAIRHTQAGTTVSVALRRAQAAVRLAITDDGQGMPQDLSRDAQTPFVQGRGAAEAASPGLGIGLALAAEIVREHGGRMDLASLEGQGTWVTVELPSGSTAARPGTL